MRGLAVREAGEHAADSDNSEFQKGRLMVNWLNAVIAQPANERTSIDFYSGWNWGTVAGVLFLVAASICQAQVKTSHYEQSNETFANPEQGFYVYSDLSELDHEIGRMRERGHTLVWGKIDLTRFRDKDMLSDSFLKQLESGFRTASEQGVKVIVRGSYGHKGPGGDYTSYKDPPQDHIKNHLRQLAPIFKANSDVIALFEAGFVGPWGEWHSTAIARDYNQGRELLRLILGSTPADRMVVVRYPYLKQRIFAKPSGGFETVTSENAYSGELVARVGHHNDCFMSSPSDVGTYDRGGSDREQETAYLAKETLHTVFGGETCQPHKLNDSPRAIAELEMLHGSYLNIGYHPGVLNKWKQQKRYDEIQRRLGARLVLTKSQISASGSPGGKLDVKLDLKNFGFASLYNPRDVQIILENENSNELFRFEVDIDPRLWKPGKPVVFEKQITLPGDLPKGSYSVHLNLPDPAGKLQHDPRYSFRIACKNVWDSKTGFNKLSEGIKID